MREFAVIHNIPSPYRLHLFRVLARRLEARGVGFHVHFMARGHQGRAHWNSGEEPGFGHTFWRDVGPRVNEKVWHLNPGMLASLLRNPPDWLLVGGGWDSLTALLAPMVRPSKASIVWMEANTQTPGQMRWPVRWGKRALLRRYRYLAVPGREGRRYANLVGLGADGPPVVTLPNIVDEGRFGVQSSAGQLAQARQILGTREGRRLALWVARLIWEKAIPEFLKEIDRGLLGEFDIVILGDGPLHPSVAQAIQERDLAEKVRIVPSVPYELMPAVYASASLLLLPSVRDANPLCVIEGMHSGLPIIVSNRIGNYPEVLQEGVNGWTVRPGDGASIRSVLGLAFSRSPDELRRMGEASRERAQLHFSSEQSMDAFLDQVAVSRQ